MTASESSRYINWYVFVAQTHKEMLAVQQLRAQSFDVLLPMHMKTVSHARKRVTKPVPLFPGYGFVGLDLQRDSWRSINGTRGVKYIISQRERPIQVPEEVISSLKYLEDESGLVSFETCFKPDDRVRFVAGPFYGLIGKLSKVDHKGRVEILLDILSSQVQVKTHARNLQPA
jgi:transcription elongation factor/antiterminator RfaH